MRSFRFLLQSAVLILAAGTIQAQERVIIEVKPVPGGAWTLEICGKSFPCAVGRAGVARPGEKREGDGMTPSGEFSLRELFFRADKVNSKALPQVWKPRSIRKTDGWSDDSKDSNYNRVIKLPYVPRHEDLWRDDDLYDLIIPLGYNDNPVLPGMGSAIFFHVAKPGHSPTAGCVAVYKKDYLEILKFIKPGDLIKINTEKK